MHIRSDFNEMFSAFQRGRVNQNPTTTYTIQLNVPHSDQKKYININNLKIALLKDLDLSNLPQDQLSVILQTLFICTGCDYISYFKFLIG